MVHYKNRNKKLCLICRTKKYPKTMFIQQQHKIICPECFKRTCGENFTRTINEYEQKLKSIYPNGKHPTHRLNLYRSLI